MPSSFSIGKFGISPFSFPNLPAKMHHYAKFLLRTR